MIVWNYLTYNTLLMVNGLMHSTIWTFRGKQVKNSMVNVLSMLGAQIIVIILVIFMTVGDDPKDKNGKICQLLMNILIDVALLLSLIWFLIGMTKALKDKSSPNSETRIQMRWACWYGLLPIHSVIPTLALITFSSMGLETSRLEFITNIFNYYRVYYMTILTIILLPPYRRWFVSYFSSKPGEERR